MRLGSERADLLWRAVWTVLLVVLVGGISFFAGVMWTAMHVPPAVSARQGSPEGPAQQAIEPPDASVPSPAPQAAAATTAPAAPTLANQTYDGPLGLKWGQSCKEARQRLQKRGFKFVMESAADQRTAFIQRFEGTFAGHSSAEIELTCDFATKELFGVVANLPAKDGRLAIARWGEMVSETEKKYGPPTNGTLDLLPNGAGMSALLAAQLEEQIRDGTLVPKAVWEFKNARIVAGVLEGAADRNGNRLLEPAWMFMGPGGAAWRAKGKEGSPDL